MSDEIAGDVVARRDAFTAMRDIYVTAVLGKAVLPDNVVDYQRERPVFVQYTNPEVLACYGRDVSGTHGDLMLAQALDATRLAVLLTESHLVVPASYLFEIPWYRIFLGCLQPLIDAGAVRYTSPVPDLAAYQEMKAAEYRRDRVNTYLGATAPRYPGLMWAPRHGGGVAGDIGELWRKALLPGGDLHGVVTGTARRWRRSHLRAERMLARTPERLEGQAFIARFVEPTLPTPPAPAERALLAFFLSRAYLRGYLLGLDASLLTDLPVGDLTCGLSGMDGRLLSARRMEPALHWIRIHEFVHRIASWEELLRLRSLPEFGFVMERLFGERSIGPLRIAALKARRSARLQRADGYAGAKANVSAVAEALADY
ncbi:hypothetical protein [Actinomadura sp. 9N407]|uniref:hypothetical protein n=1 Tax=Actinomadura sp. 9N407 TaxID=3375154 RepID=UPI00378CC09D